MDTTCWESAGRNDECRKLRRNRKRKILVGSKIKKLLVKNSLLISHDENNLINIREIW